MKHLLLLSLLICGMVFFLSACASSAIPLLISHVGLDDLIASMNDESTPNVMQKHKLYADSSIHYTITNAKHDYARMLLSNGYSIAVKDWQVFYLPLLKNISKVSEKDIIIDAFSRLQWHYDVTQSVWRFAPTQDFDSPYYRHSWLGAVGSLSLETMQTHISIIARRYGATFLQCNRIAIAYDNKKWASPLLVFENSTRLPGWEQTLFAYSDNNIHMVTLMHDILQADDIRVRFYGVQYYDELKLRGTEKIIDNLRRIIIAMQLWRSNTM